MSLLKFDPATGIEKPYPSHPDQYRQHHGNVAWLFDPYTGKQRDPRDIGTDVHGLLIQPVPAVSPVSAAQLEWSPTLCNGERVTYEKAEKAIAELGDGWRLPTRVELISIMDLSRYDPCIYTEKFPDTKSEPYWSSTPTAWNSSDVWVVYFYLGYLGYVSVFHRSNYACVLAVRSSQ